MADEIQPNPEDLLPLTPAVFHILLALADEERHGYGIMKEVEDYTQGRVLLKPGTLYQAIKRLLEGGLIREVSEEVDPEPSDERRRYYRLTDLGRRVMKAEAQRLARLVQLAQTKQVLQSGSLGYTLVEG
jgi:DNA-binding PadR family transcriptional regulator